MHRWLPLFVLWISCGRIAFDELPSDSAPGDASVANGPNNLAFVSSALYQATDLQSAAHADTLCMGLAAAADLPGTYKAWLSDASVNAYERFGSARGWVRSDGKPIADTLTDLRAGIILYPIDLDEYGARHRDRVLTGTTSLGLRELDCNGWTNSSGTSLANYGMPFATADYWTDFGFIGCDTPTRLYCFGVDRTAPIELTPATGRRAFLGPNGPLTNGLAEADSRCATIAAASGVTGGTFRALLATSTATAGSRFDSNGAPWIRLDGIPLAATAADLLDGGDLLAPLNLTADGFYSGSGAVRTGALSPALAAGTTCLDWTDSSSAQAGLYGFPSSTAQWFSDGGSTHTCEVSLRTYCLEE